MFLRSWHGFAAKEGSRSGILGGVVASDRDLSFRLIS